MTDEIPNYDYRKRCLKAKGEECIVCGTGENILVHHVDGDRSNNDLDNLIPVCEACHNDIHAGRERVAMWVRELGKVPNGGLTTNIPVSDEVWSYLDRRKGRGETFDDIIRKELNLTEQDEAAHTTHD